MRLTLILLATSMLSACSGGGPTTVSGTAVSSGTVGGVTGAAAPDPFAEFGSPTKAKTYYGIGGAQVFDYSTDDRLCCDQQGETFASHTSTVRDQTIQVTYDPREATYTLVVKDPLNGSNTSTRFQDPGSRTDFGGNKEPQWGVTRFSNPNLRYVQAGDGNPLSPFDRSGTGSVNSGTNTTPPNGQGGSTYQSTTFFYETPGSNTKYVSVAGFVRNALSFLDIMVGNSTVRQNLWHLERGAFAYGLQTDVNAVPKTGTASFTGNLLATIVYNPTGDGKFGTVLPSYFQALDGTAITTVNFATNAVTLALSGTVYAPFYDRFAGPTSVTLPTGTSFAARGTGTIDLVHTGGFTGAFSSASFGATTNGAPTAVNIAGSSFDGAFFGPKANEVGGGFHIAGGTPDQRIDIVGGYTGK